MGNDDTHRENSLMLRFPIVLNTRIVVGNAAFVLRIVEAVGHIHQDGGLGADHFVAMSDPRRYQNLPRAQGAEVQGVASAISRRMLAKVNERDLERTCHRNPEIGLMAMEMKRLDGAGIAERSRNLSGFRRKLSRQALAHSGDFQKISAVVRPQWVR